MNEILEQVRTNEAIAATSNLNIRRIVVPVDLSAHSENTAAYAVALAKTFGASITFVHVFPPKPITEITAQDFHEIYDRERDSKREELSGFANKIRLSYPHCDTEFRIGDAAEQIHLTALVLEADLIITASYHPGFLGRLFGLEQAPRIVNHAPCPVLVYHEPNE